MLLYYKVGVLCRRKSSWQ